MRAKLCPECGKEPTMQEIKSHDISQWSVICETFECDRVCTAERSMSEAIRVWNQRRKRKSSLATRKALKAREFYEGLPDNHPAKRHALNEWRKLRLRSMRKPIDTRSN